MSDIWHNNPDKNIQKFINNMNQTYNGGGKVLKTKMPNTKGNRNKTKGNRTKTKGNRTKTKGNRKKTKRRVLVRY